MGCVFKSKDGQWIGQMSVGKYPNGGPKYKLVRAATRAEAKTKLADLERRFKISGNFTLAEFFERWERDHGNVELRPLSLESYLRHWKHLQPLADIKLMNLTKVRVIEWKATTLQTKPAATVHHALTVLKCVLSKAVEWGFLDHNPAINVKVKTDKYVAEPYSLEEAQQFLEATKGDPYFALFVLAVGTGMRAGECIGLQWPDLDLDAGTVTVTKTLQRVKGKGLVLLKVKKRVVFLPECVVDAMKKHQKVQVRLRSRASFWDKRQFVFPGNDGSPMDGVNLSRYFAAVFDTLPEVRAVRFCDLRTTAASLAVNAGCNIKAVSEQLGYTNPQQMLKYVKLDPKAQQQVARKMHSLVAA